jgi:protein TonB
MNEGGFLQQRPRSPTSLVAVIAVHAGLLTALALAKMERPAEIDYIDTIVRQIPDPPPPEPAKAEPARETPQKLDYVPPKVAIKRFDDVVLPAPTPSPQPSVDIGAGYAPSGGGVQPALPLPVPTPMPTAEPVLVEARMHSGSEAQPAYPPSERRAEAEGTVTVRVSIGADGRVTAVERLSASSEPFWRATERHALRNWRFQPATRDGRPVASSKVITVRFRLEG